MTEEKITEVVETIKNIISSDFSNYAGFKLYPQSGEEFYNCFILDNQPLHSSNFTTEIKGPDDAIKIIQRITNQSREKIIQELEKNGSYYSREKKLFLHFLKLTKECGE